MFRSFRSLAILALAALTVLAASPANARIIVPTCPDGEATSADYRVSVNGESAPVWSCRVSAIPFNRVWPGYQRDLSQTELAGFVTWETDEAETSVVVECLRGDVTNLDDVVVRPLSLGIKPVLDPEKKTVSFNVPATSPVVVEINGFHNALHLLPFPVYERPADLNAPNLRYFGPGVHNAGSIEVKSGDEVFIDAGAVVYGGVHGTNVENVRISGPGILDAAPFERGKLGGIFRFSRSKNVTIDGVVQRDTDVWSTTLTRCEDFTIRNTKLVGLWRYNADGIDVCNCQNVLVENSFVRSYDDSLVVKGINKSDLPSKNLLFRNNVLWCDWGRAMELGAETSAPEFTNIRFEDSDIIRTTHIAMDIQHGDRAKISNVVFENIRVEYDDKIPTAVYQNSDDHVYNPDENPDYCPPLAVIIIQHTMYSSDEESGDVRDVLFKDIKVFGNRKPAISFTGQDAEHDVKGVTFKNVLIGDQILDSENVVPYHHNDFVSGVRFER